MPTQVAEDKEEEQKEDNVEDAIETFGDNKHAETAALKKGMPEEKGVAPDEGAEGGGDGGEGGGPGAIASPGAPRPAASLPEHSLGEGGEGEHPLGRKNVHVTHDTHTEVHSRHGAHAVHTQHHTHVVLPGLSAPALDAAPPDTAEAEGGVAYAAADAARLQQQQADAERDEVAARAAAEVKLSIVAPPTPLAFK